ncbi:MAG: hypothetical protein A3H45_00050 [Ignavibacteria bacterium RIFCSPLOWO2_02_FULL_55_14]|nr:MAG: hypothetical protein A3H45_00050 [Ignavibacteria bacterium RIFCSPLOWO2_02_FULL_55_14]
MLDPFQCESSEGQRASYQEILERLTNGLAFCRSIELKNRAEKGRFSHYENRIKRLIRIARQGKDLPAKEKQHILGQLQEYLVALSECFEFGDIISQLQHLPHEVLAPKLKTILKGPLLPSDENANSNAARNILFELNIAARLKHAGIEPQLGEHPDVRCEIAGKTLFIECKRPFTETRLGENIEHAANQLLTDLASVPDVIGIIAVSLSKALNPAYQPVHARNKAEAQAWVIENLEAAAASVGHIGVKFCNSRVVGILFHMIAVFENVETNRYDVGQQLLADSFLLPADEAYAELVDALIRTGY